MYNAKRRVLCLLLAMLLTLPFAGCSSGAGGGEKESETGYVSQTALQGYPAVFSHSIRNP